MRLKHARWDRGRGGGGGGEHRLATWVMGTQRAIPGNTVPQNLIGSQELEGIRS